MVIGWETKQSLLILVLVCLVVSISEVHSSSLIHHHHQDKLSKMMMMKKKSEQQNDSTSSQPNMTPLLIARNQEDVQPLRYQTILHPKKPHKFPTRLLMRPYDIDFSSKNIYRLRKPLEKQFYFIKMDKESQEGSHPQSKSTYKLIRTQHRPSKPRIGPSTKRDEEEEMETGEPLEPQIVGSANKFKYTTVSPSTMTTEEFIELISSAHSPVRLFNALKSSNPTAIKRRRTPPGVSTQKEEPPPNTGSSLFYINPMNSLHLNKTTSRNATIPEDSVLSNAITIFDNDDNQSDSHSNASFNSINHLEPPAVNNLTVFPTVLVLKNNTNYQVSVPKNETTETGVDGGRVNASNYASAEILFDDEDDLAHDSDFTTQLTPKRGSTTGKKPVSLIRYPSHRKRPTSPKPTMATSVIVMSSHQVKPKPPQQEPIQPQYIQSQHSRPSKPSPLQMQQFLHPFPPTKSPQQSLVGSVDDMILPFRQRGSPPYSIKLISKQKHKYDDKILSPTLTVVDNDAFRLPPNTTSVHNNKLIVAIRPGRRRRPHTSTTQFPVYNIVAGITPPYLANPTVHPVRPGSVYGLLKPNNVTSSGGSGSGSNSESGSSFGASHIRFPAAEPSYLQPEVTDPLPSHFNFTLSHLGSSGIDPNKLPDKIILDANEQYLRPPDVVVTSNSTIVARPSEADTTTNQEGLMKLKTTRKPVRGSGFNTTPRVSIISANTTIVAGNTEQLHDVMTNVIAGSHHNSHVSYNNHNAYRPDTRPSFFSYISGLFNNGITTTILGVLTLMKTVFVALLVMFLPPMALATAIMQVINLG